MKDAILEIIDGLHRFKGLDTDIDILIDSIESHKDVTAKQVEEDPEIMEEILFGLKELQYLLENMNSWKNNTEFNKISEFLNELSSAILDKTQGNVKLIIFLGNENNNIPIRTGENMYVLECSFLNRRSFRDIHVFPHEIGHIFFDQYVRDAKHVEYLCREVNKVASKISSVLKDSAYEASLVKLISNWLNEFVADIVALYAVGPEILLLFYEETRSKHVPLTLGTDSHPPDGLRIRFMRERCMRIALKDPSVQSLMADAQKLKVPNNYELVNDDFKKKATTTPYGIRSYDQKVTSQLQNTTMIQSIVYDKNVIQVLDRLVDEIIQWFDIQPRFTSVKHALGELMIGNKPRVDMAVLYGAALIASRKRTNKSIEDLIF